MPPDRPFQAPYALKSHTGTSPFQNSRSATDYAVILCMYCKHTPELDTTVCCCKNKLVTVVEGVITAKADVSHQVEIDFILHIHLGMRHVMLWMCQAHMGSWFEVVLVRRI